MIDFQIRPAAQHDFATRLRFVLYLVPIFRSAQTVHLHARSVLFQYRRSDGRSHLHARNVQRGIRFMRIAHAMCNQRMR
jgi:hypothetical protein